MVLPEKAGSEHTSAGGCSIPPKGGDVYENNVSYRTVYRYDYAETDTYKEQPPLCQVTAVVGLPTITAD